MPLIFKSATDLPIHEYPILLAVGAAAAAGGTAMQMQAAGESRDAMNAARLAEVARQKGYQDTASSTVKKSIQDSTAQVANQQIGEGDAARQKGYQDLSKQTVGAASPALPGQNTTVGNDTATARETASAAQAGNAWANAMGAAQARLGGYEDWGLRQAIKNTRANQSLAVTSNLARGSASVLPIEMEAAQHKGDELAGWGQLVSALGSVAGAYGATAPAAAAGSAAISAPDWALASSSAPLVSTGGAGLAAWQQGIAGSPWSQAGSYLNYGH